MPTSKKIIWVLFVLLYVSENVISAVLFESTFTGANNSPISSLPQWRDAYMTGSTRTVDNNQGKFYMNKYGWIYSSIRANSVLSES
jgi:hypothetical protein